MGRVVTTREFVALSFAVQRYNGGKYYKDTSKNKNEFGDPFMVGGRELMSNKASLFKCIVDADDDYLIETPFESEFELADEAIDALQKEYVQNKLANNNISSYMEKLMSVLQEEYSDRDNCGIIACVPDIYFKLRKKK